jgi:hypothetical protein
VVRPDQSHRRDHIRHEEVRAHLGVETQRQWSDNAILRTTPALLALFSIITLWTHDLAKSKTLKPSTAAWYPKSVLTFSMPSPQFDAKYGHQISFMSREHSPCVARYGLEFLYGPGVAVKSAKVKLRASRHVPG